MFYSLWSYPQVKVPHALPQTHTDPHSTPSTDHRHTDKNVPRHRDTQRHRYTKTLGHTHKHTDRYTNPKHTHTQIPDSSPVQNRKVRITQ